MSIFSRTGTQNSEAAIANRTKFRATERLPTTPLLRNMNVQSEIGSGVLLYDCEVGSRSIHEILPKVFQSFRRLHGLITQSIDDASPLQPTAHTTSPKFFVFISPTSREFVSDSFRLACCTLIHSPMRGFRPHKKLDPPAHGRQTRAALTRWTQRAGVKNSAFGTEFSESIRYGPSSGKRRFGSLEGPKAR